MSAPLMLADAALRGMVVALLLLAAGLMLRDRPRLPAAQAGALLTLGLVVQVFSLDADASSRACRAPRSRRWSASRWPMPSCSGCSCAPSSTTTSAGGLGTPWSGLWLSLSER